jgi:alcohol dehydrogenase (cytochrome c)
VWIAVALFGTAAVGLAAIAWRVEDLRWRVQVAFLVASGRVRDLKLSDTLHMLRPGSGYWLKDLLETRNAYVTIANPFVTSQDVTTGMKSFRSDCAGCHGADAHGGGVAPALVGRTLKLGNSDWALFNTIRNGVGSTSMPPHAWEERRIWQVITYLRSIGNTLSDTESGHSRVGDGTTLPSEIRVNVPYSELQSLEWPAKDWLTYSGSYSGARHSELKQIDRSNLAQLAPRWLKQIDAAGDRIEASPIVRDGIMYITHAGEVVALDARTGATLWRFDRAPHPDARACCGNVNRGVAILDDKVFVGTTDAHLIALSANSGEQIWQTAVVEDFTPGYSITGAPIAYRDLVVVGISGGDYPTSGFIAAYDANTGKPRWRFKTIPGPGEPGHETWAGESWRNGGGATWLTGSYDPKLDILYWGVGNPAPVFNASSRAGDNLYTNSVVALRGSTGEKLWHFQFSPGDDHDYDSVQIPVIVDRPGSRTPKQLLWANRNGFFYSLDRQTGAFLVGAPFVYQTWAEGLDARGRPIRKAAAKSSPRGTLVYPGDYGATNWWSPSYDPSLDLMVVPALEYGGIFFSEEGWKPNAGQLYLAGATGAAPNAPHYTSVIAIKPETGAIAWKSRRPGSMSDDLHLAGLVTTAAGLTFACDDQLLYALDTRDGRMLWSFPTGSRISASPVTFEVDGHQYLFVASTKTLIAFALVAANGAAPNH